MTESEAKKAWNEAVQIAEAVIRSASIGHSPLTPETVVALAERVLAVNEWQTTPEHANVEEG